MSIDSKRRGPQPSDPKIRFFKHVHKTDSCWIWTGSRRGRGYGGFLYRGKVAQAHRVSYELFVGPTKPDLQVCHSCDNPPCVNPAHLFLGTKTDNMRDASKKGRLFNPNKGKTFCIHGHLLTPENVRIRANGSRECRECRRNYERRNPRYRRAKQEGAES